MPASRALAQACRVGGDTSPAGVVLSWSFNEATINEATINEATIKSQSYAVYRLLAM
jgi:hypothetical protein